MNPGTAAGVDESHEQTVEDIQSVGGGGQRKDGGDCEPVRESGTRGRPERRVRT